MARNLNFRSRLRGDILREHPSTLNRRTNVMLRFSTVVRILEHIGTSPPCVQVQMRGRSLERFAVETPDLMRALRPPRHRRRCSLCVRSSRTINPFSAHIYDAGKELSIHLRRAFRERLRKHQDILTIFVNAASTRHSQICVEVSSHSLRCN
jgi:hypothetical protein